MYQIRIHLICIGTYNSKAKDQKERCYINSKNITEEDITFKRWIKLVTPDVLDYGYWFDYGGSSNDNITLL